MFVHGGSLSGEAHGVVSRGAIWFCLFDETGSRKRCSSVPRFAPPSLPC
jgi:hypothetical protein